MLCVSFSLYAVIKAGMNFGDILSDPLKVDKRVTHKLIYFALILLTASIGNHVDIQIRFRTKSSRQFPKIPCDVYDMTINLKNNVVMHQSAPGKADYNPTIYVITKVLNSVDTVVYHCVPSGTGALDSVWSQHEQLFNEN